MSLSSNRKVRETSIDRNHKHVYVLGKVRTKNAEFLDDLAYLNIGMHHHPISYTSNGEPIIGKSEGHDHQS